MKSYKLRIKRIYADFSKIHLVDKCLLLFMLVLLSQSAYSLFASGGRLTENSHIDIIVRTSSAAIFGYFLSANFCARPGADDSRMEAAGLLEERGEGHKNGEGAGQEMDDGSMDDAPVYDSGPVQTVCGLQIMTAAVIGLFCLSALILVRNMAGGEAGLGSAATPVIVQFRDFISGSVGFLIGCPTSGRSGR